MNVSAPPGEDSPDRGDFASVGAVIVAVSAEAMPAIAWTATQMRAGERIVVDETLIAACLKSSTAPEEAHWIGRYPYRRDAARRLRPLQGR